MLPHVYLWSVADSLLVRQIGSLRRCRCVYVCVCSCIVCVPHVCVVAYRTMFSQTHCRRDMLRSIHSDLLSFHLLLYSFSLSSRPPICPFSVFFYFILFRSPHSSSVPLSASSPSDHLFLLNYLSFCCLAPSSFSVTHHV